MNIYELEKQATLGEYKVDLYGEQLYIDNAEDPGDEPVWMLDAVTASKDEMLLLAHCRNNFMKALEALKEEHAALLAENDVEHLIGECQTCKLIKELEEVQ